MIKITTNYGVMVAELFQEKAPETVANFISYIKSGFYQNTLFHRIIDNFMIQGGGLEEGMYIKATGSSIHNEASNGLKNEKYTLAMARTPDPHSANSQFFINVADNVFLDYKDETEEGFGYCVFGRLTTGLDVAVRISKVETGERAGYSDVPVKDVIIENIEEVEEESTDNSAPPQE